MYIPNLLPIRCVLHPKFPASCDSFEKNAQIEEFNASGVEQRFDSWWTGGSVDAKSISRTNQRMKATSG